MIKDNDIYFTSCNPGTSFLLCLIASFNFDQRSTTNNKGLGRGNSSHKTLSSLLSARFLYSIPYKKYRSPDHAGTRC